MTAGMNRFVYSFLVAAALACVPLMARAQATATTNVAFSQNLEVRVDGEKLDNEMYVYIGSSLCKKGVKFSFKGTGYTAANAISNMEFWASAGSATDCTLATNRTKTTTSTSQCWQVGVAKSVTTIAQLDADATDIFKANADSTSDECPMDSGNTYTVYLVPLDNSTESNPTAPPAPIAGIQLLKATFSLNVATPKEPSKVEGHGGESELRVTWAKPGDVKAKSKFFVVYDLGLSSEDDTCSETALKAGQPPPEEEEGGILYGGTSTGTKSTLTGLDGKGIAIDQWVAAAVVHRDQAGNYSNLSEVVCIQRVETISPLEECQADPKCRDDFDSCSVRPGQSGRGSLMALSLLALAFTLLARARRATFFARAPNRALRLRANKTERHV